MRKTQLFLTLTLAFALPAAAAELPSKSAKSAPPAAAQRCQIHGKPGFLAADGQTCIVVSGSLSAQYTTTSH